MDSTLFREKIILESGVRNVFTPFSPVHEDELLLGRQDEIGDLIACINTPGQHALIYGERGIGKSSLALILANLSEEHLGYSTYIKKCDSVDTFANIISDALAGNGHDVQCYESSNEHTQTGGAKAGLAGFAANLNSSRKKTDKTSHKELFNSAAWAAKELTNNRTLIVIDETDVIENHEEKLKLAEFIKHLSDYKSEFKVIIVGISSTGRDLVCNHPSVERCINEIFLKPIKMSELRNIIITGAGMLDISFDDDVIDDIVDISGGYPHFVHLIALKCAEEAVVNNTRKITSEMLPEILVLASRFSDGRLKRHYEEAVFRNTEVSKKVLLAAALCHPKGFLFSEVVEMANLMVDAELSPNQIRTCLKRWINNEQRHIIKRVERGHYCFIDPRFLCYIKMINGFTYDKDSLVADILKTEYSKRYLT